MKKVALSLMAIAITLASMAQTKTPHSKHQADKPKMENHNGHMKGEMRKDMAKKLNLSDAQKSQMKTMQEDFHKQMKDLKENKSLTEAQMKERRMALEQEHHDKMQSILTPAQREQANQMKNEHGEKGMEEGKDHFKDGGKGAEKMQKELNLTDAQSAKMKSINESFRNNMKSIHQNSTLTQDQKKEQMKALQQKHKDEIESLLTPEQREKMKSQMKNRPNRKAVK